MRGLPFHTHSVLEALRQRHRGPVIAAGDSGYDAARITFNGMIDRRPEVIVRPLDLEDVVEATRYVETGQKTGNVVLTVDGAGEPARVTSKPHNRGRV